MNKYIIVQQLYLSNIPLQANRWRTKAKHVTKLLKLLSWKALSKDVRYLKLGRNKHGNEFTGYNEPTKKMVVKIDMFGALMRHRILCEK